MILDHEGFLRLYIRRCETNSSSYQKSIMDRPNEVIADKVFLSTIFYNERIKIKSILNAY